MVYLFRGLGWTVPAVRRAPSQRQPGPDPFPSPESAGIAGRRITPLGWSAGQAPPRALSPRADDARAPGAGHRYWPWEPRGGTDHECDHGRTAGQADAAVP